jgi:hypothetical protein
MANNKTAKSKNIVPLTLARRLPVKTRAAVQIKKNIPDADIEIEFDDELSPTNISEETEALDDYLLASRDATLDESDTEAKSIKDKMIGSKAKLRALMNNSDESEGTDLEDEAPADEADPIDPVDAADSDENADATNADNGTETASNDVSDNLSEPTETTNKTVRKSRKFVTKQKKVAPKPPNVKRGPGRPPKTQKKDPIPRKGIARNPHNPDSFVEVLYDQPVIMKKIFSFFKYVAAAEIQILFRPRDIIFYAMDHNGKTKIRVRVNTEKLNHYYCKDVLDVGISQKEMEMILNKVDKDYSSIVILSDVGTTRRNLTLVFENDIQIDELHRIDLIASYNKMEDEAAFIDEDYMIKFNFPSRYFKKTVGDIKSMSPQLSITQEDNESPLIFEYLTVNKRIQSKHTVKDSAKIKLESNLEDGESFRVDVCIDYLKPISASQIAEDITILVDENKCLMTKSYIDDGTIEIKTLTEIIDERPDEDDD